MTLAVADRVAKRFGDTVALAGVSLTVEPGSNVALLGPNGAGKSTLVSLLLGLRRPDAGAVRVCGRDPRHHRGRTAVAAVPQESLFPQTLRVEELVRFAARHYPRARPPEAVLAELGIADLARSQVGGLSVGQRRRVAVALALVADAPLLVLDEPTAALDAGARRAVWAAVTERRERGGAALVATHQLDEAAAVATRVIALAGGRVVADGSVAEITARAGGARIRYRADAPPRGLAAEFVDGWVTLDALDAGATVTELARSGVRLAELEVRPRTLEEALAAVGAAG